MKRRTSPQGARAPRLRTRAKFAALAAGLVLTLGWAGSAGAHSSPAAQAGLGQSIDTLLADKRLDGGMASVTVADAATGDVIYSHQPETRLMPASNTKLLTSTAAMDILGPDYRFHTGVLADGTRHGPRLDGDLYLRGTGDPTLLAQDYDALAAKVAASGIRQVSGHLVADDTRFDDRRLGTSWAWDDESDYYSSQISALSLAPDTDYDAGNVYIEVAPGAHPGDRPKVTLTPPNHYVTLEVAATTVAAGGSDTVSIERRHGSNVIDITGNVPVGGDPDQSWTTVWEPTGYAASVFRDALAAYGVRVAGRTELGRATPATAEPVADHPSMTLADLYVPFLKLSNNNHAEVLTKAMGYETAGKGTWGAGLAAIQGFLKKQGVDTSTIRQVDGSGLSRMDNVPSRQIAELLVSVRSKPWFRQWYDALPIACRPDRMVGGTLRSRMCGTPAAGNVHGKTGTLTGASSLSGYVTDADGRDLVFSIVFNNYIASSVTGIQDAIAADLAAYSEKSAAPARTPAVRTAPAAGADAGIECSWAKPAHC
jgi:serine-type D-Ala-D-Ala carboxypeptidase/endopeptidase (penicillin-binding protein 4)